MEEVDELKEKRDCLLRKAQDLQEKIDWKARCLPTELSPKLRKFWKHLADRRSTVEGYSELQDEYENCFGRSVSNTPLKNKIINPLIKQGLLELVKGGRGLPPNLYRIINVYRTIEKEARKENDIEEEVDELRKQRDRLRRKADDLQGEIDRKARRLSAELPGKLREFWKYLADRGPTFEGYTDLQDEHENCFGELMPKRTMEYKIINPLIEHGLLEPIERSEGAKPNLYRVTPREGTAS